MHHFHQNLNRCFFNHCLRDFNLSLSGIAKVTPGSDTRLNRSSKVRIETQRGDVILRVEVRSQILQQGLHGLVHVFFEPVRPDRGHLPPVLPRHAHGPPLVIVPVIILRTMINEMVTPPAPVALVALGRHSLVVGLPGGARGVARRV